ncbi:MAG TPA: DUF4833 domain-containing protein, partial [Puia sp.]|nr:DUF4833 domain-containing protein [Puia sp.]
AWPDTNFPVFETISIFTIPLTIMAFLANFTAIGRLRDARRTLEARAIQAAANAAAANAGQNGSPANPVTGGAKRSSLPGAMIVLLLAGLSALPGTAQPAMTAVSLAPPGTLHPRPAVIMDPVDTFPVPPVNANSLFYLQRTPNTNTIICELNQKDGVIDRDEPVKVMWIRYTEQRQREKLSWIQRTFAYGLNEKDLGNGVFELRFVSYKKVPMYLMKWPVDNKQHVFVTIEGRRAILNRIYIRIDPGGTFWSPNVKYLELRGVDVQNGKELVQRLNV